jgi:hypothetical protein
LKHRQKERPFPTGNGLSENQPNTFSFPYAGITQIRFKGYDLRLIKPPPRYISPFKSYYYCISALVSSSNAVVK